MDFIQYPPSRRGKQPYNTELNQYQERLQLNVASFIKYYTSSWVRFSNQHGLSRVIKLLMEFSGDTPQETYNNLKIRLPELCGSLGIVHQQPRCNNIPIIGRDDVMAYKRSGVKPDWTKGHLLHFDMLNPITIIDHSSTNLSCESYLDADSPVMGLWYIDIPLFTAMYHQRLLEDGNHDVILTELVYHRNVARLLNIATANNVETWVRDNNADDYSNFSPYIEYNLTQLGNKIKKDWQEYFTTFRRSGIADIADNGVWDNVSSPTKATRINDYYIDHLMWVSAFVDIRYFKRIKSISDAMGLGIPFKTVQKLPERLLTDNRVNRLVQTLPDDTAGKVRQLLSL